MLKLPTFRTAAPGPSLLDRLPDMAAFNERAHARLDPIFARRWVHWLTVAALALFILFGATWLYFSAGLPSSEKLLAYEAALPTNVRGYDGDPVGTFARERRVQLAFDEYPPLVVHAFLSAEDKNFFSHGGIDYPGLVGAVFDYSIKKATGGARAKGGSTITQQVAKHLLGNDEYTVKRKVREAILAFRLESTLSKPQILEIYLNSIFLGRNAYGVQAAARAYFDKDVADLTLPEAAYLAVLPKAPSNYELIKKFGEKAEDGPNSVYAGGLWVRSSMNPVMQDSAADALREGLANFDGGRGWIDPKISIDLSRDWRGQLLAAPLGTGFADWSKAVVLDKQGGNASIGLPDGSTGILPATNAVQPKRGVGGAAFGFLRPGMVIIVKKVGGNVYALRSIPEVGGGMVVEEVRTGRVLAMQGGFDALGSSLNRATQSLRQPGSAFKPIVYETALENNMTPATIIVDGPFCIYQGAGLGNKCFKNFESGYAGPKTMRWGVEQSRNLMTVRAASQIGMPKIVATAEKLGVGKYDPYLSMALGAGETTVSRLVNAYAILANGGKQVKPTLIDFVQDRNGKTIYRTDNRCAIMDGCNAPDWDGGPMPRPPERQRQLINPLAAYQ
ncbi:MAG: transglycosylase domain-containing protein, partial [Sphingomonadales bacterium]|nr:transglycosylase domain-containing protein [Sphingomonadales bacterium]